MTQGPPRDTATALIEAGLIITSELSLSSVLQKIIDLACAVADARYGALGVLDRDGRRIKDFVTAGVTAEERRMIGSLPQGHGLLGVLIREALPLRVDRIADDERSSGFPEHHPPMRSFLGVPIKVGARVFGNLYLTEKRGATSFSQADEDAVVTLAAQAGIAIENARLYADARAQEERLQALNDVTRAILEGDADEAVLELVARRARRLVGAALAAVTVRQEDGSTCRCTVDENGVQMRILDEVIGDAPFGGGGTPARPVVEVQLRAAEAQAFGTLAVAGEPDAAAFSDEDVALLRVFAGQAAVALGYARARRDLERFAVLEDRERIAKELHDGVVQSLFAVGMGLQAASSITEPRVRAAIESAVDGIDNAIRDLRSYIFGLRPGEAADRRLRRALLDLGDEFERGTDATIEVDVDPEVASALSSRAPELLQIAREALSNAVRHADASFIGLRLLRRDGGAELTVIDDGVGFEPSEREGAGDGLGNLRARAAAVGGALTVDAAPGKGTSVTLVVEL